MGVTAAGVWTVESITFRVFWGSLRGFQVGTNGPGSIALAIFDLFTPTFTPTRLSYSGF